MLGQPRVQVMEASSSEGRRWRRPPPRKSLGAWIFQATLAVCRAGCVGEAAPVLSFGGSSPHPLSTEVTLIGTNHGKASGCQRQREGRRELPAKGQERSFGGDRNVLRHNCPCSHTTVCVSNSLSYIPENGELYIYCNSKHLI